ncbi:MAG: dTMP kinase [Fibrobacteraceae bacterium]|jgi:dTMP kinase|nr:dTMP kinase [Fibrobacteraceae bacterium]MEE1277242.1 dTMP kinase [Fibrobacteraceae bacterium]
MFCSTKHFFSLEGIDGSGKTTQLELLANALEAKGYKVVKFREPGGSIISEQIRSLLLDRTFKGKMDNTTELLLYNAARAQVISEVILPALQDGNIVLADRFAFSTLAYQGYGRNISLKKVNELSAITCENCFPELTIILDIDAEQSKIRRSKRAGAPDRLEAEADSFFTKVQEGYRQIAKDYPDSVALFNALLPKEEIHEKILSAVLSKLNN